MHEHARAVSLSAFALLVSELIQHELTSIKSTGELERKLAFIGHQVGMRYYERVSLSERSRRESSVISVLQVNLLQMYLLSCSHLSHSLSPQLVGCDCMVEQQIRWSAARNPTTNAGPVTKRFL